MDDPGISRARSAEQQARRAYINALAARRHYDDLTIWRALVNEASANLREASAQRVLAERRNKQ